MPYGTSRFRLAVVVFVSFCLAQQVSATDKTSYQGLDISVFEQHRNFLEYSPSYFIAWSVLTRAASLEKIELRPVETSWNRAVISIKNDKLDAAFGAFYTLERAEWANYSLPLSMDRVFVYAANSSVTELDTSKVVGVITESFHEDSALNLGFSEIYRAVDHEALFRMLVAGRTDYMIHTEQLVYMYCAKRPNLNKLGSCLRPVGSAIDHLTIHAIFSKKADIQPQLKALNRQITKLASSQWLKQLFSTKGYSEHQYKMWLSQIEKGNE